MLTKLRIRNFKRFQEADIDLDQNVVLIGPNNSGKTTALQALALWDIGYRKWLDERGNKSNRKQRTGISINRRDLIAIPIPKLNLLWRDLHVRSISDRGSSQKTHNIRIEIITEGISNGCEWKCGLEFDYANPEAFYCRPLRLEEGNNPERMHVPKLDSRMSVAFLPPMSGLADREYLKQWGEIGVLLGQGQTAQVLRNLCYRIYIDDHSSNRWKEIVHHIKELFGVELLYPEFRENTADITLAYKEQSGKEFDISSSGRGLQQTLLLITHLYANPRCILLLDEPDAHLEILRQRQIYNLLCEVANNQNSQIIAASHSEVVLNEAASRGKVVAFVGKPHTLTDKQGSQVLKALKSIGFDHYYQAEQMGWVLYVEDATDLAILKAFAKLTEHPVQKCLEAPFVNYVATNLPQKARQHFHGLREAKPDLLGFALFDKIDADLRDSAGLKERMWSRNEIENYFCEKSVLMAYAEREEPNDFFAVAENERRKRAMEEAILEVEKALDTLKGLSPWSDEVKASDDALRPIFQAFSKKLNIPLALRKNQYHELVSYIDPEKTPEEVIQMLNEILEVSKNANPE